MESFLAVAVRVAVMIIMIAVGWFISKKGVITETGTGEITKILIDIVTPCLMISSFMSVEAGSVKVSSILLALVTAAASMAVGFGISKLFFRKQPTERKNVLRFAMIFSNAGFMGIPLIQGILGDSGVIFGSFFIVAFNVFCWTYGYSMMSGGGKVSLKKAILNPGMIGMMIGLPVYIFRVYFPDFAIPEMISLPIQGFADLNTPLAMVVVGSYIAKVKLSELFTDKDVLLTAAMRLIAIPIITIGILFLIKPEYDLFISTAIQTAAPTAANTVLFAVLFGSDAKLASKTIALTTLVSVITIPCMTVIAQWLCSVA